MSSFDTPPVIMSSFDTPPVHTHVELVYDKGEGDGGAGQKDRCADRYILYFGVLVLIYI